MRRKNKGKRRKVEALVEVKILVSQKPFAFDLSPLTFFLK